MSPAEVRLIVEFLSRVVPRGWDEQEVLLSLIEKLTGCLVSANSCN